MSSAAVIAAVIAQAIQASGVIVQVAPKDFLAILARAEQPLVVTARGGWFTKHQQ